MLFEALDTCAPASLPSSAYGPLLLPLPSSLPRSEISLPCAILPLLHPAKRHNVRCRPATVSIWKHTQVTLHGNVRSTLHVTYGVSCIKMQTMIRTTLRSHAPRIHSPADVWTVVVYRSSRAVSRSCADLFFRWWAGEKYLFGENAHPWFRRIDYGSANCS